MEPLMNEDNSLSSARSPAVPVPTSSVLWPSLSPTMRELESAIADIGRADVSVLLVGEKGTGKEIVARQIHRYHGGGEGSFLHVRCSGHESHLLQQLFLETALALRDAPGRPVTVFLDEIADLDLSCQGALVDSITDGEGNAYVGHPGPRLITSSSRNLEDEIRKQRFREDLFYRLNGICLRVPPLRHRKEDILALLEFFLKLHADALGYPPATLQPKTQQVLLQYGWPGNVRELSEVARNLLTQGDSAALAGLKSPAPKGPVAGKLVVALSLKEAARNASRQVERELILKTLSRTRWNRKRAARELGISYKALLYKLKQIAFDDPTEI